MIRKNMKLIIGFVIGLLITTGGVYAVNNLNANSVTIDKTEGNLSKITGNKLNNALDYLYAKANTTNMITIESGVLHETQTYLGIVYLDPTDLSIKCTAANSVSTTGTKTGCMKWYIYKEDNSNYYAILDHNTTARINTAERTGWNNDNINVEFAESNAKKELDDLVSVSGWKVNIPNEKSISELTIISAKEVADIVGYSGFNPVNNAAFYLDSKNHTRTNTTQGTSNYAWLFDNLGWSDWGCTDYGCNVNNATGDNKSAAYWTKTPYGNAGAGSRVWIVHRDGSLYRDTASGTYYGVRPVITILKSYFS